MCGAVVGTLHTRTPAIKLPSSESLMSCVSYRVWQKGGCATHIYIYHHNGFKCMVTTNLSGGHTTYGSG